MPKKNESGLERRIYAAEIEIRAAGDGDAMPKIIGHAAVFDRLSVDLGGWYERMKPGSFQSSIERDDIRMLWNHDVNWILGRNRAGTLRLEEDAVGLAVENDPPETSFARDLMVSMKRGDVTQMSISFWTLRDVWSVEGNMVVRDVQEVKLFDVSPVTAPAYEDTDVGVRSSELFALSTRMRDGRATPAELRRLEEILGQLNQHSAQAGDVTETQGQAGLAMRLRLLDLL